MIALAALALAPGLVGAASAGQGQEAVGGVIGAVTAAWADGRQEPVPEAVFRLIAVDPGTPYRPLAVRQSVKQIFALGLFRDVRVRAATAGDDRVDLVFVLEALFRIREIRITGAPLDAEGAVYGALGLEAGQTLEEGVLPSGAEAEEVLRDLGYLNARVEVRAAEAGPEGVVDVLVEPGPRFRIASFVVLGETNPGLERELERALGTSPGRRWNLPDVESRLPEAEALLRERGFLRAALALDFTPAEDEGVAVTLSLDLGAAVGFTVEDGGFAFDDLDEILAPGRTEQLSGDSLEAVRQGLLGAMRTAGHRDAAVTIEESGGADAVRVAIRFVCDPGPRWLIGGAVAEGAPAEAQERIAELLAGFRTGQPFRAVEWIAAGDQVRLDLRRLGYFEASVEVDQTPSGSEPGRLELRLRIHPGPLALLGPARFEGVGPVAVSDLLLAAELAEGAPYVAEDLVSARESVERFYRERGFIEAMVTVEAPLGVTGQDQRRVDPLFRIESGEYLSVGEIIVSGLRHTRESVILSRLPFAEGDPLGSGDLLEVRRRLAATGLFRSVEVDLLEPEEAVSERNLLIRLTEGPRTSLGYGVGYSEREQVRGEAEWTRRNVLGLNHALSLFARVSLKGSRAVATYRWAETVDGEIPIFLSTYREQEDREAFDFLRTGAGVQVARRIAGRQVYLRYDFTTSELSDVRINPNQIDRSYADNLWLSTISASTVADTRDDPVDPQNGRFGLLDLEWSVEALGSRAPFVKGLGQQFFYRALGRGVVLAVGGRLGAAWTLGADEPALVPITERFFAGGATTMRGFSLDRAGPLDDSGYPLGGNLLLIGNLELRFPIAGNLAGAVFSDHGGVYGEVPSLRLEDLNHNVGAGLRFTTPLGPIRFDYGVRLGDIGDGNRGQWHFTIGHAF